MEKEIHIILIPLSDLSLIVSCDYRYYVLLCDKNPPYFTRYYNAYDQRSSSSLVRKKDLTLGIHVPSSHSDVTDLCQRGLMDQRNMPRYFSMARRMALGKVSLIWT